MKKFGFFLISIFLFLDHVSAVSINQYRYTFNSDYAVDCVGTDCHQTIVNSVDLFGRSYFSSSIYGNFGQGNFHTFYLYDFSLPSNVQDYKSLTFTIGTTYGVANSLSLYNMGIECFSFNSYTSNTNTNGINWTTFYCPIEGTNYSNNITTVILNLSGDFRLNSNGATPATPFIYFSDYVTYYPKDMTESTISGAIQQQTEELKKQQEETNKQLGDLNDNLTNSDTNEASSSANEFFNGFESDDFGLSSIIIAPLNLIKSITSSTCTPIGFKAPFVDQQVTLPCMGDIYKKYFGSFLTLYQTITFGIIAYWVSVNIFFMVKGFKDPDSDRIEVLDL